MTDIRIDRDNSPFKSRSDIADDAAESAIVFIIEDDVDLIEEIVDTLHSVGLRTQSFGSPQEFLDQPPAIQTGCILLDNRMPGMSGLEFLEIAQKNQLEFPVIFMSAFADTSVAVRAMKLGCVDFLEKPFNLQHLIDAANQAIVQSREIQEKNIKIVEMEERLELLTQRERQVLEYVIAGNMNKQIAFKLGLSMRTVEVHRGNVMKKFGAKSLAELVRSVVVLETGNNGTNELYIGS